MARRIEPRLAKHARPATKVAVGIVPREGARVAALERWRSSEVDVRVDPAIGREVEAFIKKHGVRSVVLSPGIIGCPHEEGVDYEGEYCPLCPYWQGRDDWLKVFNESRAGAVAAKASGIRLSVMLDRCVGA